VQEFSKAEANGAPHVTREAITIRRERRGPRVLAAVPCYVGHGMKVKRIVSNVSTPDPALAKCFYGDVLGLDVLMDQGFIVTYGVSAKMSVQVSFLSEGGSGSAVPDLSIEVDDVDEAHRAMKKAGFEIEYGLTDEPWGVRRFYVRDPFGKLINILMHR
jgi:catechol 2,3-dioxygenase-like lactoylglutathione lyase family enzyme